jgi:hypothetical protein
MLNRTLATNPVGVVAARPQPTPERALRERA